MREWGFALWDIVKRTFTQWQAHRSAQMAAALAFYGAIALAGLSLVAVYVAAGRAPHAGHVTGAHNARILDAILREAASRRYAWVALVTGGLTFVLAVLGSALQLQSALDAVWDVKPRGAAKEAGRHAPQLAAIFGLTLLLLCLLFTGAAVHALMSHSHALPVLKGLFFQALDVGASIVLLTGIFLVMFAYLPPADIPWRNVWLGAFVSAVLYERGQFALALYLGQMEAASPYADAGAILAVLIWLYYSGQVVLIGAIVTKVLKERAEKRAGARKNAA